MVKIIQIPDCHCYSSDDTSLSWSSIRTYPNKNLQKLIQHLRTIKADCMIITGDLSEDEKPETYQKVDEMFSNFPIPVYALADNHDQYEIMNDLMKNVQTPRLLEFSKWKLALLDSNHPICINHLKNIREHHLALFMHHHPVQMQTWADKFFLVDADNFWKQVEENVNIKAIFHGHIHHEFCTFKNKVKVVATPATSIQATPNCQQVNFDHNHPAWREITLYDDGQIATEVFYLK